MTCHKCNKDILGNFIVFSAGGGLVDKNNNSTNLPGTQSIDTWITVISHSDRNQQYTTVEIFDKLENDNESSWSTQGELYFCSKQCLVDWFKSTIDQLPNP